MRPRHRSGSVAVGAVLVLLLAGCGSTAAPKEDRPSKAVQACRDEWKDLGDQVRGNDSKTNPSALAARWNSVVATIAYYASSAKASDCDEAIAQQKEAISALEAFSRKLAPYDMPLRFEQVREDAETYAAGPRPTPSPSPKARKQQKSAKKPKAPPPPPAPAAIAAAVKTLIAQSPRATEQQGPGWQQARVVELTDDAATAKAVKDLAFLSTESPAYRACRAALAQIRLALAASS